MTVHALDHVSAASLGWATIPACLGRAQAQGLELGFFFLGDLAPRQEARFVVPGLEMGEEHPGSIPWHLLRLAMGLSQASGPGPGNAYVLPRLGDVQAEMCPWLAQVGCCLCPCPVQMGSPRNTSFARNRV